MRNRIWRSHRKSPIKHPQQKRHPSLPTRQVVLVKTPPDEIVTRPLLRHGGQDDNRDDPAHNHKEHARVLGVRQELVAKDDGQDANPENEEVGDVDVPGLEGVGVAVVNDVHADGDVGRDLDQGGEVEHPAVKVDPAGEEAEEAAVLGAAGDGGPVVDASCCWDGGGELGDVRVLSWRLWRKKRGNTSASPRPMKV